MKGGVYKLYNKIDNKTYIGSTNNFVQRKNSHLSSLRNNKHGNKYLQNAFDKYGEESFVFEPIIYCDKDISLILEQHLLDKLDPEYNICSDATRPNPIKYTDKLRQRVSEVHSGKIVSEETKRKISKSHSGKKLSGDHREKLRISHLGIKPSKRQRKIASELFKGNTYQAKTYNGLISPEGDIYYNIYNLSDFCRENDLEVRNLNDVIHGKGISHREWRYIPKEDLNG